MRKSPGILMVLVLCAGVLSAEGESEYYDNSYARLSFVNGDVFVQRAEDLGYEEGVVNLALIEGDKLGTREGRAEVYLGNRNYLRIDRNSQIDFVGLPRPGDNLVKLHLLSGRVSLRIGAMDREKDIELHTPDASFYLLDIGLYEIEVTDRGETEFFVAQGAAEAAGESGSVLVERDEWISASDGRILSGPESGGREFGDDFFEWCASRDAFFNRSVARRHLPDELSAYEAELDYYGRWEYERPYGYVWIPRVYETSWRPYWNGRWVWYPIIGWTWVSYDPWGWCVSHYGRWHWSLSFGWHWIPTRHWGPAWVHWYHGRDYYGWAPLSYYGCPGVILHNRFYARHHFRDFPAHSRSLVVVHRGQLQARHVSRAALDPARLSGLGRVSLRAGGPAERPAVDRSSPVFRKAAQAMARGDVRKVRTSFPSGRAGGAPQAGGESRGRIAAPEIRSPNRIEAGSAARLRSATSAGREESVRERTPVSGTSRPQAYSSGSIRPYSSRSLTRERRSLGERSSSSVSERRSSGRMVRSYPSRSLAGRSAESGTSSTSVRSLRSRIRPESSRSGSSSVRSPSYRSRTPTVSSRDSARTYSSRGSVRGRTSSGRSYGASSSSTRSSVGRSARSSSSRSRLPSHSPPSGSRSSVSSRSRRSTPSSSGVRSSSRGSSPRSGSISSSRSSARSSRSAGSSSRRSSSGRSGSSRSGSRVRKK